MGYLDVSDFEINCLVAEKLGWKVQRKFLDGNIGFTEKFHERYPCTVWILKDGLEGWEQVCFTATGEEAFPIIFDNRIGLTPNEDGSYKAFTSPDDYDCPSENNSDNPLRAAMIEFLKMDACLIKLRSE